MVIIFDILFLAFIKEKLPSYYYPNSNVAMYPNWKYYIPN